MAFINHKVLLTFPFPPNLVLPIPEFLSDYMSLLRVWAGGRFLLEAILTLMSHGALQGSPIHGELNPGFGKKIPAGCSQYGEGARAMDHWLKG